MIRASFLVLLAAVALAGCGSAGGGDPMKTAVAAAKKTLSDSAVVHVELQGSTAFGGKGDVFGRAVFAFGQALGYERLDVPTGKPNEYRKQHLTYLGDKIYFDPGAGAGVPLPQGKVWVLTTVADGEPAGTPYATFVQQAVALSPEILLDEIAWGAASATSAGNVVINHLPVAKYSVMVDLKRTAAAATGAANRPVLLALKAQLAALKGPTQTEITVWVDGTGNVSQLAALMPGTAFGTISVRLTRFGIKFGKSLPLADQVVDISAVTDKAAFLPPWFYASAG